MITPHENLHAREGESLDDGSYRAMTVRGGGTRGLVVWVGRVGAIAAGLPPSDIRASDYVQRVTVHFVDFAHVWPYFAEGEYAALAAQIKAQIEYRPKRMPA
ncbi:hypothetical protein ACQQ2N_12495 [Dokdonella sp. MW10]|uniref:hypothetical protein n=1 Tax=Dokdonella sp. MW10 TaxID=2992926 RepID=UPI003F7DF6B5